MDIANRGKVAIQGGAGSLESAAHHVRRDAGEVAERAVHGARRTGRKISSLVRRRPVETALPGTAACLISGVAFWCIPGD